MPCKNSIKEYNENGIYHVYNRGVAKNDIFLDKEDYKTFLYFLKIYLTDPEVLESILTTQLSGRKTERKNYFGLVELLGYCLMPNHFHLLIKQKDASSLTGLMRSVMTSYSMCFNNKYDRVGHVFQGRYKAVNVNHDEQLIYLTKYIHLNPCKGQSLATRAGEYDYSSCQDYLGLRSTKWVCTNLVRDMMGESYREFMNNEVEDEDDIVGKLKID